MATNQGLKRVKIGKEAISNRLADNLLNPSQDKNNKAPGLVGDGSCNLNEKNTTYSYD